MRFALASLVLLAVAVGLSAAPIPKEKAKAKDEEAILGTWQLDKFDLGPGWPQQLPIDITQMKFTFKAGGKVTMSMGELMPPRESEYKLDPAAKVKAIDITADPGRTAPGIYELDGDTLKICVAEGNNATRPTEMKADGKQVAVVTFKRVKEEKKEK